MAIFRFSLDKISLGSSNVKQISCSVAFAIVCKPVTRKRSTRCADSIDSGLGNIERGSDGHSCLCLIIARSQSLEAFVDRISGNASLTPSVRCL